MPNFYIIIKYLESDKEVYENESGENVVDKESDENVVQENGSYTLTLKGLQFQLLKKLYDIYNKFKYLFFILKDLYLGNDVFGIKEKVGDFPNKEIMFDNPTLKNKFSSSIAGDFYNFKIVINFFPHLTFRRTRRNFS